MNKILKYTLLFYIFFTLALKVQGQAAEIIRGTLQKHNELTSDALSEAQVQAYHKRAKQKLGDMVDYMRIILNSKQADEQSFALRQLQKLFRKPPAWARSAQSLRAYLGNTTSPSLKAVKITKPLTSKNNRQYQGKINYQIAQKKERLNFTVSKNIKSFGRKRIVVWKLFF